MAVILDRWPTMHPLAFIFLQLLHTPLNFGASIQRFSQAHLLPDEANFRGHREARDHQIMHNAAMQSLFL